MKLGKWTGMKAAVLSNRDEKKPLTSIYNRTVYLASGQQLPLEQFKGKKVLLVNTASDCGYTAQYEELQQLYERFPDRLNILAFPANDFKEQEKGDDASIEQFCKLNYGVSFPVAKKSSVIPGPSQHPVFHWLSNPAENGWCNKSPEWNFSKYLLNEEGVLINYFAPGVSPLDVSVIEAVNNG
ncbi:glutathione peroxidase [Flavihumibacter cheonanensis]|uniref:glutathione peroxidase n=1 Tax=Flavihumibacter cheonanensis TaxID=1442385 RepID=UPI001EF7BECB|nr:glutathione peroxidase [Flavihumibacter cheonanensis]MCG7754674.1 glutathione peroxidase [Flavihumibacter cheonanensis]